MADDNTSPADKQIIELLGKIADDRDARGKKEDRADEKASRKKLNKGIKDTALSLVGLTTSMFSLQSIIGDQIGMNSDLAKSLGKTGEAVFGMTAATKRFDRGAQGSLQMVKVFGDAVEMGMTKFSDSTLKFGTQLKVLGVDNKKAFALMRSNTQGLGLAEDASLSLADSLVSTAVVNKDSISGLIEAINGMKDAMISTTVELGPKAALNAQKIAAMMSQGNSDLQDSSAKFVKSFLAGSDGYMKAAKLGVQFTGKESTAEMARKFETILGKIQGLQAGKQGSGSQFFFDAMDKSFGLSREDFNLQTQIGTSIKELVAGSTKEISEASARINLQQQIYNALEGIQTHLMGLAEGAARFFATMKTFAEVTLPEGWNNYIVPMAKGIGVMAAFFSGKVLLSGLKILLAPLRFMAKGMGWIAKGATNLFRTGSKEAAEIAARKAVTKALTAKQLAAGFGGKAAKAAMASGLGEKEAMRLALKVAGKGTTKSIIKKIPFVGLAAGLGFGVWRALKGDFVGAAMEVASGALGTAGAFTMGAGTAASFAMDAALLARDVNVAMNPEPSESPGNPTGIGDSSVIDVLKENNRILGEVLDSNKTQNELTADQTEALTPSPGNSPIRAGI
jgi:hypothetical protein